MVRNNTFFLLGGVISISLFVFFLSIFVYMLFVSKNNTYALKKDNYISVSLDAVSLKNVHIKKNTYVKKTKKSKRKTVDALAEDVDVGDLFENVWTKKIDKTSVDKKKKVDYKRIQEIQKKAKTLKNNNVKDISEILKTDINKNQKSSVSNEVNEYFAKIHALVYSHFDVSSDTIGGIVKVVIELDPFGKMLDFRILEYSDNEALNNEAKRMKKKLKNVIFPKSPNNSKGTFVINLIPKEKE